MSIIGNVARSGSFAAMALATALFASPASAAVSFSESSFNSATFLPSSTYAVGPGALILAGQCPDCGVGGSKGLIFSTFKPANGAVALGIILNNISYDTAAGAVTSITSSIAKNLASFGDPVVTSNRARTLIKQGSTYYYAETILGDVSIPTPGTGTGFQTGVANYVATDFSAYDFSTGLVNSALHPDFANGILNFGILQITAGGTTAVSSIAAYDDFSLSLAIAAVPEPASWVMMIGGFGLIGGAMRRRKVTTRLVFA